MKKIRKCENCKYYKNGKYTDLCYWDGTNKLRKLKKDEIMNKYNNCKNYD